MFRSDPVTEKSSTVAIIQNNPRTSATQTSNIRLLNLPTNAGSPSTYIFTLPPIP